MLESKYLPREINHKALVNNSGKRLVITFTRREWSKWIWTTAHVDAKRITIFTRIIDGGEFGVFEVLVKYFDENDREVVKQASMGQPFTAIMGKRGSRNLRPVMVRVKNPSPAARVFVGIGEAPL